MAFSNADSVFVERRVYLNGSALSTYRPAMAFPAARAHAAVVSSPSIESLEVPLPSLGSPTGKLARALVLFVSSVGIGLAIRLSVSGNHPRPADPAGESILTAALASEYSGKAVFFETLNAQRRAEMRRKAVFVSAVIRSQLPNHPNADQLAQTIVSESYRAHIDPIFVASVIRSESMFRPKAVSHRGARGLMQIMPDTGRYVAEKEKLPWGGVHVLNDPATNVRLGIAYLKYLEQKFRGHSERMLIAYNWGPGNLASALSNGGHIPLECIQYARKILGTHKKWNGVFTEFVARLDGGTEGPKRVV